jgi:hypothetical protein
MLKPSLALCGCICGVGLSHCCDLPHITHELLRIALIPRQQVVGRTSCCGSVEAVLMQRISLHMSVQKCSLVFGDTGGSLRQCNLRKIELPRISSCGLKKRENKECEMCCWRTQEDPSQEGSPGTMFELQTLSKSSPWVKEPANSFLGPPFGLSPPKPPAASHLLCFLFFCSSQSLSQQEQSLVQIPLGQQSCLHTPAVGWLTPEHSACSEWSKQAVLFCLFHLS